MLQPLCISAMRSVQTRVVCSYVVLGKSEKNALQAPKCVISRGFSNDFWHTSLIKRSLIQWYVYGHVRRLPSVVTTYYHTIQITSCFMLCLASCNWFTGCCYHWRQSKAFSQNRIDPNLALRPYPTSVKNVTRCLWTLQFVAYIKGIHDFSMFR